MKDNDKTIEKFFSQIRFDDIPDPEHRDKLEQDLLATLSKQTRQKESPIKIWRIIMKNRITKLATAAAVIIAVTLGLTIVLEHGAAPAWAIEQTIESLEKFNAVHICGTISGSFDSSGTFGSDDASQHGFNLWARTNEDHSQSSDFRLEVDDGQIRSVQGNDTYHYDPDQDVMHIIRGQKASISPWIGRELLQTLEQVTDDWQALYGKDPATGRKRVFVTCSCQRAHGPRSWWFEFDLETKLLVSFKQWHNLYRQGKPNFDAQRIIYYEDLPDEMFEFEVPKDTEISEAFVPSWVLDILDDPNYGISTEGLTQDEACHRILEQFWQAVINADLTRIRKLLPVSAAWNDKVLKANIGINKEDSPVEVLEIGRTSNESDSNLGPVAVVPSILKCEDGKTREVKMIIQFRQTNGQLSCVLYANYGKTREIE